MIFRGLSIYILYAIKLRSYYRRFYQHADSKTLLQMYISLIRPHLEYGSPVWNPYKAGDARLIKGVQKFALRMCTKSWTKNYETLLEMCLLRSHENRRIFIDIFKIVQSIMCFPHDVFLPHQCHQINLHSGSRSSFTFATRLCSY